MLYEGVESVGMARHYAYTASTSPACLQAQEYRTAMLGQVFSLASVFSERLERDPNRPDLGNLIYSIRGSFH